ncbi:BnaAnng28790D, partial [Brassica napus]
CTMYNGMDYGIFFSKIAGNIFKPRVPRKAPRVEVNLARSKADTKDGLETKVAIQRKEKSKVTASRLCTFLCFCYINRNFARCLSYFP